MSLLVMRRSELEINIDILKALARHGPLKVTHITYKANVNSSLLKQYLIFQVQHNLVEEQTLHKKGTKAIAVYAITERGRVVLKCFRKVIVALKGSEEANKIPPLLY